MHFSGKKHQRTESSGAEHGTPLSTALAGCRQLLHVGVSQQQGSLTTFFSHTCIPSSRSTAQSAFLVLRCCTPYHENSPAASRTLLQVAFRFP